jgi:hypothetical protein
MTQGGQSANPGLELANAFSVSESPSLMNHVRECQLLKLPFSFPGKRVILAANHPP